MVGPALYEATVPYFRKAVDNQIKLLQKGKEWCKDHNHGETKLTHGRLVKDMFVSLPRLFFAALKRLPEIQPLPFHVTFTSFNVIQFLVDLGATDAEAEKIQPEGLSLDELIQRAQRTLAVLEGVDPARLEGKEENTITINLGNLSVTKSALECAHHITGPSLLVVLQDIAESLLLILSCSWFHHSMVYSILRVQGVPLDKRLFLSAF